MASTDPSNVNQSEAEPSPSIPRAYDYSWILRVLQPGKKLYDGHGVARPSAFVGGSGQKFIHDLEVMGWYSTKIIGMHPSFITFLWTSQDFLSGSGT